jgi:hypothetical protein
VGVLAAVVAVGIVAVIILSVLLRRERLKGYGEARPIEELERADAT